MRENVSYAKCTCDVCGDVKHIAQSRCFPDGWGEIRFPMEINWKYAINVLKEFKMPY